MISTMTTDGHDRTLDTLLTIGMAAAVIYFCFTESGRRQLDRFEHWLDAGERETDRLMRSVDRVTTLASSVSQAWHEAARNANVAAFPASSATGR